MIPFIFRLLLADKPARSGIRGPLNRTLQDSYLNTLINSEILARASRHMHTFRRLKYRQIFLVLLVFLFVLGYVLHCQYPSKNLFNLFFDFFLDCSLFLVCNF